MVGTRQENGKSLDKEKKDAQSKMEETAAESEGEGLPDGGWGWMVVLASLVCNIVVDGVCYSFGVFQEKYMERFEASNEQAGWVGSLLAGCYLTVGPVVSVLAERFGSRKVTIVGSVIACGGFILSTQATSIEMLIVTWGVIGGIGFGMIYLPAIVTVGHWFDKKRAFATGLAVCGTGIGTFVFAPLSQRLVQEYDWHGAHLIIAGIVLNCVVCGFVFRPLDKVKKPRQECYLSQVEIQRGLIMKALIEEKKRQRTISNGSLNNCIITRDNQLIKIDPAFLEMKRRNSFITRFKRSLGFSSQSLDKSKTSLNGEIPSIVIEAVNEAQKESNAAKLSPVYRPSSKSETTSSPSNKNSESASTLTKKTNSVSENGLTNKNNASTESSSTNKNSLLTETGSNSTNKASSPTETSAPTTIKLAPTSEGSDDSGVASDEQKENLESMSLEELLARVVQEKGVADVLSCSSNQSLNTSTNRRTSGLDASIISVQVLPHYTSSETGTLRKRNSDSGSYVNPLASSASSLSLSVPRSLVSIPQQMSQYSIETIAAETGEKSEEKRGTVMKMVYVLRDMIDVNLLKSPMFSLLVVASVLTLFAFFIPFFYITTKAEKIVLNKDDAVFQLSIIGVTNTIGRVISGWIADRPWANVLHLNNGALIIVGTSTILIAFCDQYAWLCIYSATFGFCVAVFVSLRSILLVDLLGIDMLTKSFGILILFQGLATMVGAPMAGRLLDSTGSVDNLFIMAGALLLLSGLMGLPLWILKRRQKRLQDTPPPLPEELPFNLSSCHVQSDEEEGAVGEEG